MIFIWFSKVEKKNSSTNITSQSSSSYANNIPQSNTNVNSDKSSIKYSMQESQSNTQKSIENNKQLRYNIIEED